MNENLCVLESLTADTIFYRDTSPSVAAPCRWIVAPRLPSSRRCPPIDSTYRRARPSTCVHGWLHSKPMWRAFLALGCWHSDQKLISQLSDSVSRLQSRQLCNLTSYPIKFKWGLGWKKLIQKEGKTYTIPLDLCSLFRHRTVLWRNFPSVVLASRIEDKVRPAYHYSFDYQDDNDDDERVDGDMKIS